LRSTSGHGARPGGGAFAQAEGIAGAGGARFILDGVTQAASQEFDVTAAQLSRLIYQSGSGTDTLWVATNDGMLWGNWSNACTVNAPIDNVPVVTASSLRAAHGASFAATSLSNRIQVRPLFATNSDPSDGAKTGVAEPPIAKQSRSWRAATPERVGFLRAESLLLLGWTPFRKHCGDLATRKARTNPSNEIASSHCLPQGPRLRQNWPATKAIKSGPHLSAIDAPIFRINSLLPSSISGARPL
jgi:hypothetical protein